MVTLCSLGPVGYPCPWFLQSFPPLCTALRTLSKVHSHYCLPGHIGGSGRTLLMLNVWQLMCTRAHCVRE